MNTEEQTAASIQEHREYLKERIASWTEQHAQYQKNEAAATEEHYKLAMNSCAASAWDQKCEMERALENFNKLFPKNAS